MPRQRVVRSALNNFLGTFTSRYTSLGGYWLFGFVISDLGAVEIDLLATDGTETPGSPLHAARLMARRKFAEQARVAGVHDIVTTAHLCLERGGPVKVVVNQRERPGWERRFVARARTVQGREFQRVKTLAVASHDSTVERRSYGG